MNTKNIKRSIALFSVIMLEGCSLLSEEPQTSSVIVPPEPHAQLISTTSENTSQDIENIDSENIYTGDYDEDNNTSDSPQVSELEVASPPNLGDAEGTFEATDIYGNTITQEVFTESQITVFNVWGTFCGYCIDEMPDLGELASEYNSADVQIIGVVSDVYYGEDSSYAEYLIDETGANYTHLLMNDSLGNWNLYGVEVFPFTFIIDNQGAIIGTVMGSRSKSEWKEIINSCL